MMEKIESDSEDSEDEEESCKEMASLYSVFLPRHLRPKATEFCDNVSKTTKRFLPLWAFSGC